MKCLSVFFGLLVSSPSFSMHPHDMSNLKAKQVKQLLYAPEQKMITAIYYDDDTLVIKDEMSTFNGAYIWICSKTKQETGIVRLSQQESKELFDLYVKNFLELHARIKS